MSESTEIILFIICLFLSGFYSGSEAALISIPLDRIKQLMEEGGNTAKALEFMASRPNEILATILIGNNLVNIFAASLTTRIAARHLANDALAISVGLTTLLVLIFGEIIPKTFGRSRGEKFANPVIRVLQVNYYLMWPLVKFFNFLIVAFLGSSSELTGRLITKNDIEFMVNKAEKEKSIDSKQIDLLSSILEFPTIKVKNIMVPRNQIMYISDDLGLNEILEIVGKDHYSRYPVCKNGDLDQTIGFLHVKDLAFVADEERSNFDVKKFLKDPFFVYEHMKIQAVFDHMNRKKIHLALVKDENGIVVGIVTLEDIVEEILGEIQDEHDIEETGLRKQTTHGDGIIVEGVINLRDLNNEYDLEIPLSDNYSTLAGFLLEKLGNNFPKQGNIIVWENFSFELVKVVNYTIKEVKILNVDGESHLVSKNGSIEAESSEEKEQKAART